MQGVKHLNFMHFIYQKKNINLKKTVFIPFILLRRLQIWKIPYKIELLKLKQRLNQ